MRAFLIAAAIAGLAAPAFAAPVQPSSVGTLLTPLDFLAHGSSKSGCVRFAEKAADTDRSSPYARLDQQPPGQSILTVLRSENGCPVLEARYRGQSYLLQPPAHADNSDAKAVPLNRLNPGVVTKQQ